MTNDASALVGQISAQGALGANDRLTIWLQGTQAIAAVATTIGVLIALYVAVIREPKKAAGEHRRHAAQIDAVRRAVRKRVAAQARKVVPSCVRAPMFGDTWWTVRIDNTSNAVTTILAVDVAALDAEGIEVPDGCRPANDMLPVDQAFDRSIRAALSESDSGRLELATRLSPTLKRALRNALIGHLTTEWQRLLPPNHHTVMAYIAAKPEYTLRVIIDYEDDAGYQWQRTDISSPRRMGKEPV